MRWLLLQHWLATGYGSARYRKEPMIVADRIRSSLIAFVSIGILGGCASAAQFGDGAIRATTLGRIQATPFMDFVDTEACRETLTQTIGFTHETQSVTNGVHITQAFQCDADRVLASVSLKNLNPYPMHCVARTEAAEHGSIVEPYGFARFEYAFRSSTSHSCRVITS